MTKEITRQKLNIEQTYDEIITQETYQEYEITLEDGRVAKFQINIKKGYDACNFDENIEFINEDDFTEEEREEIEEFLADNK